MNGIHRPTSSYEIVSLVNTAMYLAGGDVRFTSINPISRKTINEKSNEKACVRTPSHILDCWSCHTALSSASRNTGILESLHLPV